MKILKETQILKEYESLATDPDYMAATGAEDSICQHENKLC